MLKSWKTWLYPAFLLPCAAVLCLHAYNISYTRFISDDYCSAYLAERLGVFRYIWYWYLNWGGRFSAIAADMALAWTGTGGLGFAIIVLVLLAWGTAFAAVIFGLQPASAPHGPRLRAAVCFGVLVLFVVCLLTPNVPQSLYWWNGFRTHTLPLVGYTVSLAAFLWIRACQPDKWTAPAAAGLGFLLALANAGFSETFALTQAGLFVLLLAWHILNGEAHPRRPGFAFLAAGLAGALLAILVIVLAPGNELRQAYYAPSPGVMPIVQLSLSGYFALLKAILTTPEKISGLAGAFLAFAWLGQRSPSERAPRKWEAPAALAAGLLLALACFPPAVFGTNELPPERAQIIPTFFLLLGLLGAAFIWGKGRPGQDSRLLPAVAVVLVCAAAIINGIGLLDASARYIRYAQAWDQNEQKILAARAAGQESVVIHSVRNWAGLNDPGDNPKFYVNYCMSKYYEIDILADNTGMQPAEP